jgi:hypothetical protein
MVRGEVGEEPVRSGSRVVAMDSAVGIGYREESSPGRDSGAEEDPAEVACLTLPLPLLVTLLLDLVPNFLLRHYER